MSCEQYSCELFPFFAFTLVAMLPESKWLSKVVFNIGVLCTSIDGESQSLETLLGEVLKFMSMDWDSLTTLLLSIYCLYLGLKYRPELKMCHPWYSRSVDRCVSIRDCCAGDPNSDCCVSLTDCCASGNDNDWFCYEYYFKLQA